MSINNGQLKKIIQNFNDTAYNDEKLQELLAEYYEAERLTGIRDELILSKIFDYLDGKLQAEIRAKL